jgi:V8-like Glu-specific endopeptidase
MREDVELRKEHGMKLLARCVLAAGLIAAIAGGALAQDAATAEQKAKEEYYSQAAIVATPAQAQAALEYWTPERMASAIPRDATMAATEDSLVQFAPAPPGPASVVNGCPPGGGECVQTVRTFSPAEAREQFSAAPQTFGTAPTDPLNGPYGPFQRWTMEGQYPVGYRGVIGKFFFSLEGSNYVCSASVFGRSSIVTASHCVHGGPGSTWGSNFLFCPSYYNGGPGGAGIPYPTRGCWTWAAAQSTIPWISGGEPDYDYACVVLAATGDTVANKVGNVTGWAGRAWNWVDVPEIIFGYPQGAPFTGQIIQQVAAPDWYNWDPVAGGQVSKVVGNDMTGGSSGGPWYIGWRAPGAEFPDTDNNSGTDPATAGPYANGVNSHKRCLVNCNVPPTANNGLFWQEMTSPPFRGGGADTWESEDIFATTFCLAHANNNP